MAGSSDNEYIPANVATHIKTLRRRIKLSQRQFADLIDVSVTLLKQWENGQAQPPISYWQRIVVAETKGIQALRHNGAGASRIYEPGVDYVINAESEIHS